MGYIHLLVYIQCKIDNILQDIREWACGYIDDIVCREKFLADLLVKLHDLFEIFLRYNIWIQPTKFYLNYPDVALLDHCVNSLELSTF